MSLSTTMEVNRGKKNQFVQTQNSKEAWKVKSTFLLPFNRKSSESIVRGILYVMFL